MTMSRRISFNAKSLSMGLAALVLALGLSAVTTSQAQAHHRDGRVVAGVIAGVAIAAILASRHKKRHRHRHYYYDDYDRGYHVHSKGWRKPYRYKRRHRRHQAQPHS